MSDGDRLTKEWLVDGREYLERWFEALAETEQRAATGEPTAVLLYAYRLSPGVSPGGQHHQRTLLDQLASLVQADSHVDVRLSRHLTGAPNRRAFDELDQAGVPVQWSPGTIRQASHEKFCLVANVDYVDLFTGSVDPWNPRWDDSHHAFTNDNRYGRLIAPSHDLGLRLRVFGDGFVDKVRAGDLPMIWPSFRRLGVEPIHKRGGDPLLYNHLHGLLSSASSSIYIEDQYFLPDIRPMEGDGPGLLDVICDRVSDGVELTVVLPGPSKRGSPRRLLEARSEFMVRTLLDRLGDTASKRVRVIGRVALNESRTAGRKLYVHSKLVVVDGREAIVGSNNFTARSVAFDNEFAVRIADAASVSQLKQQLLAEHSLHEDAESVDRYPAITRPLGTVTECVDLAGRKGRSGGVLSNLLFRYIIDPTE
jgi:hypothetical protein